ncbi:acyl-CoA thioesterase [Companilactobacillus mishanensis]|uniref:Acyl-CoA thioesterase n=1 Tax=Companilactobacillus mishanensis TaxID=2486008 RepID=A0A5P0ZGY2_9LACO|nr:acyl-CoA thioesterase [Companilactobacillus mishanensis]MQS44110.1 acyl-CoA thioesterase [Companilactobacillus mishanensis]MQS52320.1 acyl-CoA thioesterase [Companilactobacillus mishanensis]
MSEVTCDQTRAISDRIIFDGDMNDKGTLFGGKTLSLLDENAGLAAFKYTNAKVVTASYDHMNFWSPITPRDYIRLQSYVTGAAHRAIEVFSKITTYDVATKQPIIAFTSFCTMVTLKEFGEVDFDTIVPETDEEKYLCSGWSERVQERRIAHQNRHEFLNHLEL